jgi:hypothetical protein
MRVFNRAQAIIFAIVIVAAIASVTSAKQTDFPIPPPSPYDKVLYDLDEEAIKQAYKTQVENVFAVWMRDQDGQPQRAYAGVQQARRAFIGAMAEIERRRK